MKIDFHIVHYNEPNEWIDAHKAHIEYYGHNCYVVPGQYRDLLNPRINGYQQGISEWVSFVDPDDIIDLSQLPIDDQNLAWYTNSYRNTDNEGTKPLFIHNEWSWNWHKQASIAVHQIAVINRSIIERVINDLKHTPTSEQSHMIPDMQIYGCVAKYTPWIFYKDHYPYVWRERDNGLHNVTTVDAKHNVKRYVNGITPVWL